MELGELIREQKVFFFAGDNHGLIEYQMWKALRDYFVKTPLYDKFSKSEFAQHYFHLLILLILF